MFCNDTNSPSLTMLNSLAICSFSSSDVGHEVKAPLPLSSICHRLLWLSLAILLQDTPTLLGGRAATHLEFPPLEMFHYSHGLL